MKISRLTIHAALFVSVLLPGWGFADDQPSYQVAAFPKKYQIKRNEQVPIHFYFSGQGQVIDMKFAVYSDDSSNFHREGGPTDKHGIAITIPDDPSKIFKPVLGFEGKNSAKGLVSEMGRPRDMTVDEKGDIRYGTKPYFALDFSSPESGDHAVRAILTYRGDTSGWQTAETGFTIRVTSWLEDNQWWIAIAGLLLAVPLWGVLATVFSVWLKRRLGLAEISSHPRKETPMNFDKLLYMLGAILIFAGGISLCLIKPADLTWTKLSLSLLLVLGVTALVAAVLLPLRQDKDGKNGFISGNFYNAVVAATLSGGLIGLVLILISKVWGTN